MSVDGESVTHCPLCLSPMTDARTMLINASPGSFEGEKGYVAICPACSKQNLWHIVLMSILAGVFLLFMVRLMGEAPGADPPAFFHYLEALIPGEVPFLVLGTFGSLAAIFVGGVGLGHLRFWRTVKRLGAARANRCHVDGKARRRSVYKAILVTFFAVALAIPVLVLLMTGVESASTSPKGYQTTVYHGSIRVSQGASSWSDVNPGLSVLLAFAGVAVLVLFIGLGIGLYRAALTPTQEEAVRLKAAFPKAIDVYADRARSRTRRQVG